MFKDTSFEFSGKGPSILLYTQKTLAGEAACTGVGVHSGIRISLTIKPAKENSGISFVRTDVFNKNNAIKVHHDNVHDTKLCTCLRNEEGVTIATIEHLMSAFHAYGITNAVVEVSGPEVPILDGSAAPFMLLIECAGVKVQNASLKAIKVLKKVRAEVGGASATLEPAPAGFIFDYLVDYPNSMITNQVFKGYRLDTKSYAEEISKARTFGFLHEIEYLQKNGLAKGGSLNNAVVVDGTKILNPEGLRYPDEFVRHKMLDAIGDIYTCGYTMIGRYDGIKAGHMINNMLLKALFASEENYEIVDMNEMFMGSDYDKQAAKVSAA